MRKFKSTGQAQRFLSVQGAIQNMFSIGRHLLSAKGFRELRSRAFSDWDMGTMSICSLILEPVSPITTSIRVGIESGIGPTFPMFASMT